MILNKTMAVCLCACVAWPAIAQGGGDAARAENVQGTGGDEAKKVIAWGTPLRVVVTVPALKGLVEPLLPPGSSVITLMRPGRSEHGYELTSQDIAAVAKCDLFVYVGLALETRVERIVEKRGERKESDKDGGKGGKDEGVLCLADVLGLRQGTGARDVHEEHGGGEHDDVHAEHEHASGEATWVDQHIWLDPVLVRQFVPKIADRVKECLIVKNGWADSDLTGLVAARDALVSRVAEIDTQYRERLAPFAGKSIVTHHDAFSRVAERYGLKVAAVVRAGEGGESTAKDIARVIAAVRESGAGAIFREPQFDAKAAERIADRAGVRVLTLDPLGDGDWFAMMHGNLDALCEGLAATSAKEVDTKLHTGR